jgi:hypothetical protein
MFGLQYDPKLVTDASRLLKMLKDWASRYRRGGIAPDGA